jgi:hypothetical protein
MGDALYVIFKLFFLCFDGMRNRTPYNINVVQYISEISMSSREGLFVTILQDVDAQRHTVIYL